MTPPKAKEPELAGLSAVREKLEEIRLEASGRRVGQVEKIAAHVSEALALIESEPSEQEVFQKGFHRGVQERGGPSEQMRRDHEAMEVLRATGWWWDVTRDGDGIIDILSFAPKRGMGFSDPTDAILGTEGESE